MHPATLFGQGVKGIVDQADQYFTKLDRQQLYREHLRSQLQTQPNRQRGVGIQGSFKTTGVFGSDNNLVVEEGTLIFSLSTGQAVIKARYLLVWERVNGILKIFRDTLSSDAK